MVEEKTIHDPLLERDLYDTLLRLTQKQITAEEALTDIMDSVTASKIFSSNRK